MATKRTIIVSVRSPDGRSFEYLENGNRVAGDEEYSPRLNTCLNGEDFYLEIDIDTGNILNWEPPTEEQMNSMRRDFSERT